MINTQDQIALYIHWPFCISKCPYCDFNSHVRDTVDQDAWREALLADLAFEAALRPGATLGSIFFGGGTPSLMPPATVAALIDAATKFWPVSDDIEITLEANPSSVEASRFDALALGGINRVSLGLQSLDNAALHFLGRAHSVQEGLAALDTAQRAFARVNFDLIYALPGQGSADWHAELNRALGFGTTHLSLYQLTIEPGTRFATMVAAKDFIPADADQAADLFEMTTEMTAAAGLPAYETSNHAALGAESRHNLTYWRYNDYLGIGPGAHGRRHGTATVRHKKPENWMSAIERNGHGIASEDALTPAEGAREALVMGLRLREGVDLQKLEARFGFSRDQLFNMPALETLSGHGLIDMSTERATVLPPGRLLLDRILAEVVRV
jgi:putative oxygen-independent coproporphyrinogen III oxidase